MNKGALQADLKTFLKQEPVKKNPLNPRTYGKALTIYDRRLTQETQGTLQKYLRNNKGFYDAEVSYSEKPVGRKLELTYDIILNDRAYVAELRYESEDPLLLAFIQPTETDSIIKIGTPLDAQIFDRERTRIIDVLKNNGYAEFNTNFIEFRGDLTDQGIIATIFIYGPLEGTQHIRYRIGDINVYTEHHTSARMIEANMTTIENVKYYSRSDEFIVDPSVIHRAIALRQGDIYRKEDEFKTTRNTYKLPAYRLVTLDPYVISPSDSTYHYNIYMTPRDNKWAYDMGVNFFYSNFNQITDQDLIGFNGSVGLQNRNFNNKAIRHSFGVNGTFELNLSNLQANSLSIQFNNRFEVPKLIKVFNFPNLLKKIGFMTSEEVRNYEQSTNTDIDFNFGTTSILNFYNLRTVNANISYVYQPTSKSRWIYKPLGISILNTDIKDRFRDEILMNNPLLAKSFENYLLSGFLIKDLSYFRELTLNNKSSLTFINNLEFSGIETYFLNRIFSREKWKLGGINFAEFFRLEADIRYNTNVKERSSFAARFNTAIAVPFTGSTEVPFVRQYFVGGPNSMRGWQLRELGPGAHSLAILNPRPGQPFFQTGEFKLEMNAEYRFDLFWFWEGALFVDAGNVWTLKSDASRPGSKLSRDIIDQMAVNFGWGIRADFDYFLLRFDFGYKLRNPFPDPETNSRYILTNGAYNGYLGNITFAINYPF